jgi:hypothetical protein
MRIDVDKRGLVERKATLSKSRRALSGSPRVICSITRTIALLPSSLHFASANSASLEFGTPSLANAYCVVRGECCKLLLSDDGTPRVDSCLECATGMSWTSG